MTKEELREYIFQLEMLEMEMKRKPLAYLCAEFGKILAKKDVDVSQALKYTDKHKEFNEWIYKEGKKLNDAYVRNEAWVTKEFDGVMSEEDLEDFKEGTTSLTLEEIFIRPTVTEKLNILGLYIKRLKDELHSK